MGSLERVVAPAAPVSLTHAHDDKIPARLSSSDDDSEGPPPDMDTMKEVGIEVPSHPIPSMQGAFAESMTETAGHSLKAPLGDAATRRRNLIDQPVSQETHAARWRQRPYQQYHQLWKLMAQISFGIYLLLNGIAKDDEQVMSILQGHVDEVDEFLETTLEDFDLAMKDVEERMKLLKLPLQRIEVFDTMLKDATFRQQIIAGNEKIKHVITRTATAMNDALRDVTQGVSACTEFTKYLAEEQDEIWREERPEMQKVFDAMKGNVDGWYKAYISLQTEGNHLGVALVQLGSIVAEIDRRAGDISRKTTSATPKESPSTSPVTSPHCQPLHQMRQSMSKTFPPNPSPVAPVTSAGPPVFQLVEDREPTPEPADPQPRVSETYLNLDDSDEEEVKREEENSAEQYILAPRTYTPVPSPKLPSAPFGEPTPPPEEKQGPPLRDYNSIDRDLSSPEVFEAPTDDDGYWGPRRPVYSVSENAERQRINSGSINNERHISHITVHSPQELEAITTPPSRGLDSAYCSDPEKTFSPPLGIHPAIISNSRPNSPYMHGPAPLATPPMLRDSVANPRSELQYFLPVNASPHSPLQRPWTAAPASYHAHHNSNLSNLSNGSNASTTRFQAPPSSRRSNLRAVPSAMGMSTMSYMTATTENGTKIKKKKGPFGWLKKAFSLSEEEKLAFQERRNRMDDHAEYYNEPPKQKWLDGKRIR